MDTSEGIVERLAPPAAGAVSAMAVFPGPGEMAARCRAFDWASTALGPAERWSQSLRTMAGAVIASRNPMLLFWGPELIQLYNDAFRPSLGAPTGPAARHPRALGMRANEFWTDVWAVVGPQIMGVMTRGEAVWHEDMYLPIERDGQMDDAWWTYSYSPVRDDDGRINGTLVVCLETTSIVRARLALERERARADEANRAKSEFLAMMSHELRTPLNAIGGYAELLQLEIQGPITAEQRGSLERLQRSQRHLMGLIDQLLSYARIEASAMQYRLQEVSMPAVLADSEALVAPLVRAKGLTLDHLPCAPTLTAYADREKVEQILLNLLSNAVKFTPPGGRITIECTGEGAQVRARVSDTGRGIPADQLERVFQPFVQVDAALTRTQEGTGLGLAISQEFARGMGGEVTVESEVGSGSTFTLWLTRSSKEAGVP